MSRVEALKQVLHELQTATPDIQASALVSDDGLMIACSLPKNMQEDRVGAISATLLNVGTQAAADLRRGALRDILIHGDEGYACMISAGSGTLLLTMATASTTLGRLLLNMRRAIEKIGRVL